MGNICYDVEIAGTCFGCPTIRALFNLTADMAYRPTEVCLVIASQIHLFHDHPLIDTITHKRNSWHSRTSHFYVHMRVDGCMSHTLHYATLIE